MKFHEMAELQQAVKTMKHKAMANMIHKTMKEDQEEERKRNAAAAKE